MDKDTGDKVALIDLDGTVADYDGEMDRQMRKLCGPGEIPFRGWDDVPEHITNRRDLIKRQPGFWRNLPRLPLGFEIVEELHNIGFELHTLTKGPVKTTPAWTEKVEWCQEHLPYANVTVTQKKSLVYGRVLVDDFPPYFTKWLAVRPRGLVICVAHPWNEKYAVGGELAQSNVIRYDGSTAAREMMKAAVRRAWERKPGEAL